MGSFRFQADYPPERSDIDVTATNLETWKEGEEDQQAVKTEIPGFGPIWDIQGEEEGVFYRAEVFIQKANVDALREELVDWRRMRNTKGTVTIQQGAAPVVFDDMWCAGADVPDKVYVRSCKFAINFVLGGEVT